MVFLFSLYYYFLRETKPEQAIARACHIIIHICHIIIHICHIIIHILCDSTRARERVSENARTHRARAVCAMYAHAARKYTLSAAYANMRHRNKRMRFTYTRIYALFHVYAHMRPLCYTYTRIYALSAALAITRTLHVYNVIRAYTPSLLYVYAHIRPLCCICHCTHVARVQRHVSTTATYYIVYGMFITSIYIYKKLCKSYWYTYTYV